MSIVPLDINCPWGELDRTAFPVCEEAVCSWVREPGNTYSNVAYFLVGAYLLYSFFKKKNYHDLGFALSSFFIGICSSLAHASVTHFFGFFDFAAIFSIFSLLAAKNASLHFKLKPSGEFVLFLLIYAVVALGLYTFEQFEVAIFIIYVLALLCWEYLLLRKSHKRIPRWLLNILIGFLIGGVAIGLDSNRVLCDPSNHFFQLHMLWHVAMATNILFLAFHMRETRIEDSNS